MKSLVHKSAKIIIALCLASAIEIAIPSTSSALVSLYRPHPKKVIFYPLEHLALTSIFPPFPCEAENRPSKKFGFATYPKAESPSSLGVAPRQKDSQQSVSSLPVAQKLLSSPASPFEWEPNLYISIPQSDSSHAVPTYADNLTALAESRLLHPYENLYNYTNPTTIAQSPDAPPPTPTLPQGEPPSLRLVPTGDYRVPPSISVAMPFAYGLFWRSVGIGLGGQSRTRYTNQADGGLGINVGLGNPQKFVGFDIGVSIFDLSEFATRGSFSFKIHRTLPDDWAVAVGIQNAIVWGYTDAGTSVYGVFSKTFRLQESVERSFSLLVISGGLGSGQFRSESDIKNDRESVGAFGSVALRVAEPVNAIAEWTGQDLTLGLSYVPFHNTPLVLTGAVTDIAGNAGDGSRLLLRVGYIFSF